MLTQQKRKTKDRNRGQTINTNGMDTATAKGDLLILREKKKKK